MNRRIFFPLLMTVVVVLVVVWAVLIVSAIGVDKLFGISELPGPIALEAFSHFGSSFGILAALFAGLAVVLLWQSIKVQQNELLELRTQMLHDRRITEFTWLLNAFESSRSIASISRADILSMIVPNRGSPSRIVTQGHELIYKKAIEFIEKRKSGDLFPASDLEEFKRQHLTNEESEAVVERDPLMPFYLASRQVAKYLFQVDKRMCKKLYPMFASIATPFDMIVLHEKILILDDREFQSFVESIGMFSEYGDELKEKLDGGPVIGGSAFSI